MTEAELKALQARVKERSAARPTSILGPVVNMKAKGKTKPRERGMNKTERRYSEYLDSELRAQRILYWGYECMKVRLADECTWTPDFLVMDADGVITLVDTKAWWSSSKKVGVTDDSLVKMKVAAEAYPFFRVVMTWLNEGVWNERVF